MTDTPATAPVDLAHVRREDAPFAGVRLVFPDENPRPECGRCHAPATLEFKGDYELKGMRFPEGADDDTEPEETTETIRVRIFSCNEDAAGVAANVAYAVAAGPTGAV